MRTMLSGGQVVMLRASPGSSLDEDFPDSVIVTCHGFSLGLFKTDSFDDSCKA